MPFCNENGKVMFGFQKKKKVKCCHRGKKSIYKINRSTVTFPFHIWDLDPLAIPE